ncbi:serine proteinase stubble-like [Ischnura elegans]|uniref:serine proteinase stubble-like n=1 Tax=Ischnura elegans TaxID=197161 RepID=UPI001ED8670A|nr:serine proteinase stubble-like [Ischnura elegans]
MSRLSSRRCRPPRAAPSSDLRGHRPHLIALRGLALLLVVLTVVVDATPAYAKMDGTRSATPAHLTNSYNADMSGARKWPPYPVSGVRGGEGKRGDEERSSHCTLTLFCWLAGGWPARKGCSMEAGGGALVAPWWLLTARCTPHSTRPLKQPLVRRPPTPPPPPPMPPLRPPHPLPDRRHHIVMDNPRPAQKREMECGIPRLSPRGISYRDEEEYSSEEDEPEDVESKDPRLKDAFLDDSEDVLRVGEEAAGGAEYDKSGRIRPDVLTKRIVGGSEARFGEFPWQAHIRIAGYQCGGVLVGRAHVATAAHCVHRARLRDITVFLGEHDTQNTGLYSEPLPGEARRVVKKVIHPEFQYRVTQPDRYDVALLRLSRPVSFRANIIPICLPAAGQDALFRGRLGVVAGWGKTDTSYGKTGTNILHKATVPILRDDECLRWHRSKNIRLQLHSEMFCAGHRDGHSDACLGDSGGPLVVLVDGRWTLAGITSAGFGCAVDHQPGIYHKVTVTADWIAEHVT